ncbi:hypothetical protein GQ43DRAFT_431799 [Delitschia confertaspora ATCC 74209]|uniref:EF-hand domain-containing protein n=1 Tax=Delitschia confertaspora ATCC 74209 TaxID=1513339 RepID=A0A9P4JKT7_9PLEO|nr:hypothetical protein GQ43DRAFT_431799 [Delitschia confertaspora ATCC 74209]
MKSLFCIPVSALALLSYTLSVSAHGDHAQAPVVADDADWATRHMAEEHHITAFDAATFFSLHDYDSTGKWSPQDIMRTYGLYDVSNAATPSSKKAEVVDNILKIFDHDHSGYITRDEFEKAWAHGSRMPDFGVGPGHHGDDEYEYEIHHWEKYHGDDTKEEDLTHPEDIAHFAKHEKEEQEREEWERVEKAGIVEKNIPAKFRIN